MKRHLDTKGYVLIWVGLLALTALSFGVSYAHLGRAEMVVALLIAFVKSGLVIFFFMHLAEERFSMAVIPLGALLLFALLVTLTALDVATRRTFPPAPFPAAPEELPPRAGPSMGVVPPAR